MVKVVHECFIGQLGSADVGAQPDWPCLAVQHESCLGYGSTCWFIYLYNTSSSSVVVVVVVAGLSHCNYTNLKQVKYKQKESKGMAWYCVKEFPESSLTIGGEYPTLIQYSWLLPTSIQHLWLLWGFTFMWDLPGLPCCPIHFNSL